MSAYRFITLLAFWWWLTWFVMNILHRRRARRPQPCSHWSVVDVRTDNDLDRGTLVAKWCPDCETQLPVNAAPTTARQVRGFFQV